MAPLVSLFGRLVARSGRKRDNGQTDGRTDGRTNDLAAHAPRVNNLPVPRSVPRPFFAGEEKTAWYTLHACFP